MVVGLYLWRQSACAWAHEPQPTIMPSTSDLGISICEDIFLEVSSICAVSRLLDTAYSWQTYSPRMMPIMTNKNIFRHFDRVTSTSSFDFYASHVVLRVVGGAAMKRHLP